MSCCIHKLSNSEIVENMKDPLLNAVLRTHKLSHFLST